eukprot:8727279-Pyramimonas_sp.AAC.1
MAQGADIDQPHLSTTLGPGSNDGKQSGTGQTDTISQNELDLTIDLGNASQPTQEEAQAETQ